MVNVYDYYDGSMEIEGDMLEAMFQRQRELMEKYHHIEEANGLLLAGDVPVDIHDRFGQARIKDFAWRTAEELGEALEAFEDQDGFNETHFREEIADALHFLIELSILAGVGPDDLDQALPPNVSVRDDKLFRLYYVVHSQVKDEDGLYTFYEKAHLRVARFIKSLGVTCNTLKNKPWKQTHMLTDTNKFYRNLEQAWIDFIRLCSDAEISPKELVAMYFGKSEVNKFRQRSDY